MKHFITKIGCLEKQKSSKFLLLLALASRSFGVASRQQCRHPTHNFALSLTCTNNKLNGYTRCCPPNDQRFYMWVAMYLATHSLLKRCQNSLAISPWDADSKLLPSPSLAILLLHALLAKDATFSAPCLLQTSDALPWLCTL